MTTASLMPARRCANLRQHRRGVDARNVLAVERGQAVEDRRRRWARWCDVVTSNPVTGEVCVGPGTVFRMMSFTSRTTASVRSRLEPGGS